MFHIQYNLKRKRRGQKCKELYLAFFLLCFTSLSGMAPKVLKTLKPPDGLAELNELHKKLRITLRATYEHDDADIIKEEADPEHKLRKHGIPVWMARPRASISEVNSSTSNFYHENGEAIRDSKEIVWSETSGILAKLIAFQNEYVKLESRIGTVRLVLALERYLHNPDNKVMVSYQNNKRFK